MFKLLLVFMVCINNVFAGSHATLPPDIERLISSKITPELNRNNSELMLHNVLRTAEASHDELKGCVTKTRTVCIGKGADRECTTDTWEVCVSTD